MNEIGCLVSSVITIILIGAAGYASSSDNQITMIFVAIGIIAFVLFVLLRAPHDEEGAHKPVTRVASAENLDGYQYEHYCASYLRHNGWTHVIVTSKSADYGADITATDPSGIRYAIQCKKYDKPVGISAVQQVVGAKAYYDCQKGAVFSYSGFTDAAKKLSQANGIELHTLKSYSYQD